VRRVQLILDNLEYLLSGAKQTLYVSILAFVGATVLGSLVALARASSPVLRRVLSLYVDIFRTVPFIIQAIWAFFALPVLLDRSLSPFVAGVGALILYEAAFFSEIFRAGILAVGKGQRYAGMSLGMTSVQVNRRVILPQAVVSMLPVMSSQTVLLIKDSCLLSVIGVAEMLYQSQQMASQTFEPVTFLTGAMVFYFVVTYLVTIVYNVAYNRLQGK
jgi:polar amino acid transport system permease protein